MTTKTMATCPDWCDSSLHGLEFEPSEDSAVHCKPFGTSIFVNDHQGAAALSLTVSIDSFGIVLKDRQSEPSLHIDVDEVTTIAEARALAAMILEAADFWEKLGY